MTDSTEVLLNPQIGERYIVRPQYRYELPIVVNSVDKTGVSVTTETKHHTNMLIPIKDWNRHVKERIIKKAKK